MEPPDFEKYRHHMGGHNMSDTEKDEVTLSLWRIAAHFIDQAFGDSPDPNKKLP